MKKKINMKMLSFILAVMMIFTMMPMMGVPVYADDPAPVAPGIALGSEVLSVGSNTSGAATVYCGTSAGNPVAWRVIGYKGDGVASTTEDPEKPDSADTMTLIAEVFLKTSVQFNPEAIETNKYKDSSLHKAVNDLTDEDNGIFSKEEKAGIVSRTLEKGSYTDSEPFTNGIAGDEVENALLWPLSTQEAHYMDGDLRNVSAYWWLRSPGNDYFRAAAVQDDGDVEHIGQYYTNKRGLRPAFNYNLESVLFTSAAERDSSTGTVDDDSLEAVSPNTNNEWKLTVKDKAHKDFNVDSVTTCDGKTLTIKYSKAVKGDGEYISAIIKTSDGKVKSYGKLALASDEGETTVKVNIDGKMETGDKLCIFNEKCNGAKKTDYASELKEITIPAPQHTYGGWERLNDEQHQRVCIHDKTHTEKADHTWGIGIVTKEATVDAEGERTFTCSVCKGTKTEAIPKLTSGDGTGGDGSVTQPAVVETITVNTKTVNAAAINKVINGQNADAAKITTIVLGAKVKKISKNTFKGFDNLTTLEVKTKKLKAKTVKNSLKGSKVKTVQVKVGSKKVNKKYVKKYKKIFTKKNAGKKVTVK